MMDPSHLNIFCAEPICPPNTDYAEPFYQFDAILTTESSSVEDLKRKRADEFVPEETPKKKPRLAVTAEVVRSPKIERIVPNVSFRDRPADSKTASQMDDDEGKVKKLPLKERKRIKHQKYRNKKADAHQQLLEDQKRLLGITTEISSCLTLSRMVFPLDSLQPLFAEVDAGYLTLDEIIRDSSCLIVSTIISDAIAVKVNLEKTNQELLARIKELEEENQALKLV